MEWKERKKWMERNGEIESSDSCGQHVESHLSPLLREKGSEGPRKSRNEVMEEVKVLA